VRRAGLALPALAVVVLAGCAATDRDVANDTVCRTALQQAGTMTTQLDAQPPDTAALRRTLQSLHDTLQVRDSDASDQMRGDALVLQLNVRSSLDRLAAGDPVDAARLRQAVVTFRSRECT
jgi:hypothetical protein